MTKFDLEFKIKQTRELLQKYEKQLADMETVFYIDDKEKPFKKWTIKEQNELYQINSKAWEWLSANTENNILDYNNNQIKKENEVLLYK